MGDNHNPWVKKSQVKDPENLQSIAEYFSRENGLPPDQTPRVVVGEHMGSNGLPDLGFTTTHQVMHQGEPPFVPQVSPTGFTLLKPGMSSDGMLSTLRHEAEHNYYNHMQGNLPYQRPFVDFTHGPRGADALGEDWSYDPENPADSSWLRR